MAAFLADLKVSLGGLHDPKGHPLLFQSLRHGTETTQDLARSADPAILALFGSFAAPIRRYSNLWVRAPTHCAVATTENGASMAAGRCGCASSGYHANHVHPRGWISSACS